MNLSELVRGGTLCLGKAGFGEATTLAGGVKNVAADGTAFINIVINGIMYVYADTDDVAITAAAQQATLTTCLYLITLTAAASPVLATVKGTEVLTADITSGKKPLTWPAPAVDTCPVGAIKVVCATPYTFTAGTTDLGATGITDTYYDLFAVPDTPITS